MSKTYTTAQGDMWDSIAHAQLGDVAYTDKLMRLNTKYRGYYIFPAGITLTLPEISVLDSGSTSLPPWKLVSG